MNQWLFKYDSKNNHNQLLPKDLRRKIFKKTQKNFIFCLTLIIKKSVFFLKNFLGIKPENAFRN